MTPLPVGPAYGRRALTDLLPAVLAGWQVPGCTDVLGLEPAARVCLVLVDGLGARLLAGHPEHAPFLASMLPDAGTLSAPFPSTTAASLACLGTGRPPGEHGIVGYQSRIPGTDTLLNALRWADGVDPLAWQPHPTLLEQAEAAGVDVAQIAPGAFRGSGLTMAALRGGRFLPASSPGQRVAAAAAHARAANGPALTYVYYGDLDATGHRSGCGSPAWRLQLAHLDLLVRQLAETLPAGTRLLVTADHGMVDTSPAEQVDLARRPDLLAGVRLVGGESRARHLYTEDGAAGDVLATWQEQLGDRVWAASRAESVAAGWFGPQVDADVLPRIGDVVVAARGGLALVHTAAEPMESRLIGVHGSLTDDEMLVPLLAMTV